MSLSWLSTVWAWVVGAFDAKGLFNEVAKLAALGLLTWLFARLIQVFTRRRAERQGARDEIQARLNADRSNFEHWKGLAEQTERVKDLGGNSYDAAEQAATFASSAAVSARRLKDEKEASRLEAEARALRKKITDREEAKRQAEESEARQALAEQGRMMRTQELMRSLTNWRHALSYQLTRAESARVSIEERVKAAEEAKEICASGLSNARDLGDPKAIADWEENARRADFLHQALTDLDGQQKAQAG